MIITNVVDGLWCPSQSCSSATGFGLANRCDSNRCDSHIKMLRDGFDEDLYEVTIWRLYIYIVVFFF